MSILIVQIFLEIDYQKCLSALLLLFDPTNRLQAIRISLYGRGAARADATGTDTQRRSGCAAPIKQQENILNRAVASRLQSKKSG